MCEPDCEAAATDGSCGSQGTTRKIRLEWIRRHSSHPIGRNRIRKTHGSSAGSDELIDFGGRILRVVCDETHAIRRVISVMFIGTRGESHDRGDLRSGSLTPSSNGRPRHKIITTQRGRSSRRLCRRRILGIDVLARGSKLTCQVDWMRPARISWPSARRRRREIMPRCHLSPSSLYLIVCLRRATAQPPPTSSHDLRRLLQSVFGTWPRVRDVDRPQARHNTRGTRLWIHRRRSRRGWRAASRRMS